MGKKIELLSSLLYELFWKKKCSIYFRKEGIAQKVKMFTNTNYCLQFLYFCYCVS